MKKIMILCTLFFTVFSAIPLNSMLVKCKTILKYNRFMHQQNIYPLPEMFELHEQNSTLERQNKELLTQQHRNRLSIFILQQKNRLLNEEREELIEVIRNFKKQPNHKQTNYLEVKSPECSEHCWSNHWSE
jgi:hypothetical protein